MADNVIVFRNTKTRLLFPDYTPMGQVPGLEGVVYPACSGVSYRGVAQRTHGRKTGANPFGIIVPSSRREAAPQPQSPKAPSPAPPRRPGGSARTLCPPPPAPRRSAAENLARDENVTLQRMRAGLFNTSSPGRNHSNSEGSLIYKGAGSNYYNSSSSDFVGKSSSDVAGVGSDDLSNESLWMVPIYNATAVAQQVRRCFGWRTVRTDPGRTSYGPRTDIVRTPARRPPCPRWTRWARTARRRPSRWGRPTRRTTRGPSTSTT